MTHFTDEELVRWSSAGPGVDKARVQAHLRECRACATRYADAICSAPATDVCVASDAADFVAAGYRAGAHHTGVLSFSARLARRPWLALAAAAVLVAAVAIPLSMRPPEGTAPEIRPRGAEVQLLSPAGAGPLPAVFEWASGVAATRFRVEVGQGGSTLFSTETDRSPLTAPADLRAKFTSGQYWWQVTALDRGGSALVASPRQAFTIAAPPR